MFQPLHNTPGEWPEFRHDPQLSGFQPLPGNIRRPAVAWKHYLGGPVFDAQVCQIDGATALLLLYGGCLHACRPDGRLIWKSRAFGLEGVVAVDDVDRDGQTEVLCTNGKSIYLLAASSGELLWQEYLGPPFAAGFMHTGALLHHFPKVGPGMQLAVGLLSSREVMVYDFSPGARNPERRHILWMDDFFHPSLLALDIDGDGDDELIVTKYSAIYAFDPVTGREKSACRWSSGGTPKRNYGLFQARDLTGDGRPDFVVLSERVSRHMAVVTNHGAGDLRVAWDRFIEHIYPDDRKELHYSFNSCCDVDRDGRMEIVASTYNDTGDQRWWLEVIDALTGQVRYRLPNLYLRGIQSIDPSEPPLLLASEEGGRDVPEFGRAVVLQWNGQRFVEQWSSDDTAFVGRFIRTDARSTTFRSELPPADEVWCLPVDGIPSILMRSEEGGLGLLCRSGRAWNMVIVPGSVGIVSVLAVEDLDGDGRTELVVSDARGLVRTIRADGSEVGRLHSGMRFRYGTGPYYMAKPMGSPVTFSDGDTHYCAVPDGGERIHLLRLASSAEPPEPLWDRPGRGRMGPEEAHHSVVAMRFGKKPAVVMASVGNRVATLRGIGVSGDEIWNCVVPDLWSAPSTPPGRLGVYDYRFVGVADTQVLVVSGYTSASMNSERTCGLDVLTGKDLWGRRLVGEGEDGRGFGPWNAMSVGGSDEHPEIYFLAKDTVCAIDGRTGRILHEPWQLRPFNTAHLRRRGMTMDDFAAYGSLIPVDVDNDGVIEWVVAANYGGVGVINADHGMRWWLSAPLSSLSGGFPGIADVDGDGLPELGLSYADGDFVCLRGDTGEEKWRLHLGQASADVVACDIDGDGRPEFILATQQGELIAIGVSTSGCGLVKWRLDFGYSLGPPAVGDLSGRGESDILLVCGDGNLYCVTGS